MFHGVSCTFSPYPLSLLQPLAFPYGHVLISLSRRNLLPGNKNLAADGRNPAPFRNKKTHGLPGTLQGDRLRKLRHARGHHPHVAGYPVAVCQNPALVNIKIGGKWMQPSPQNGSQLLPWPSSSPFPGPLPKTRDPAPPRHDLPSFRAVPRPGPGCGCFGARSCGSATSDSHLGSPAERRGLGRLLWAVIGE